MPTLYDQFNRPIERTQRPEARPLAAAPIMESQRDYVSHGLTPLTLASMFRDADGGDIGRQAELFEQIEEKDAHLMAERDKRRNTILEVEFKLEPASDDARDARVVEFIEEYLEQRTDWDDCLVALQDAVGKGFAALELEWEASEGQAVPERMNFIEQKRFAFKDDAGHPTRTPRLLTDDAPTGVEIPAWKCAFHQYGGKSGAATRAGIYRVCAWWFLFKNYAIKDWVVFCEVFGMPLRLGRYDSGASEDDKRALYQAIASLGSDAAGIISKSTEIDFIETSRGATSADLYKHLAEFGNKEISKALLGQTLSADQGERGSYSLGQVHNEVRQDLRKADGRALVGTLRHQLLRPLVGFNFGWDTPVPNYKAIVTDPEDLEALSGVYKSLREMGQPMSQEHISLRFGVPLPDENETPLAPLQGDGETPPAPTPAKFGLNLWAGKGQGSPNLNAPDVAHIIGAISGKIENKANLAPLVAAVKKLLVTVGTLEEFRDGLFDLFQDMDASALANLMAKGMALAELSGRFDVVED